jgi:polysaccharide biosynthesis/export protein
MLKLIKIKQLMTQMNCKNFLKPNAPALVRVVVVLLPAIVSPLPAIANVPIQENTNLVSPAASGEQSGEVYTLGAGDHIQIDLFDAPEHSGENGRYQVLVDGSLNLPLLGSVPVQGMTLKQVSDELSRRYAYFFKRPLVTVTLLTPRPLKIGVTGEVTRPGIYTVSLTSKESGETQFPTVTSVLKLAGGIDQRADIHQIQIRRPQRSGPDQLIQVNLWQFLQTGDLRQDPTLRDGDSVIVPIATQPNLAERAKLAAANFSPDEMQINVVGEVRQPGVVKVRPNAPLNQALLAAGGFDNKRARRSSVELIRLNPDGTVSQRKIPIDFAQGVNEKTNPELRNQDVIVVGRSGFAKFSDTLDGLFGPFSNVFSIFNIFGW